MKEIGSFVFELKRLESDILDYYPQNFDEPIDAKMMM